MDSQRREQIKEHYKHYPNPVALLNDKLECVYCNKPLILSAGCSFKPYMQKDIEIPIKGVVIMMIILNGVSFCGRFEQFEEELIKCELFDSDCLQTMAEQTDFFGKGEKFLDSAMNGLSKLRSLTSLFSNALDNNADVSGFCGEYSRVIWCLSSVFNNVYEYSIMLRKSPHPQPVNAVLMIKNIVERCNTILSRCGRCIYFICNIDKGYINADKRYAFNALVNLIHNALIYSPRDCVPIISLTAVNKDDRKYLFLKASNETALFNDNLGDGFNCGFYRLGFGMKIIKHFAERADGEYIENISEKCANIGVLIPVLNVSAGKEFILENGEIERYDTGIPDLLEVKMQEVVDFFGAIT